MTMKAVFGNRRIAGEIFQGAISLTILAFVILLYFSNYNVRLFDVPNSLTIDSITGKNLSFSYYINSSETPIGNGQFTPPSERVIILRMDDVQAYGWDDISINITETVLKNNMSITLGMIPDGLEKPNPMRAFLMKNSKNPGIEIAQHGTDKHDDPLTNASVGEIYNSTKIGMQKIAMSTGFVPITFVTPFNDYSLESTEAFSKLGFRILSAKEREFRTNGYLTLIGYDTQTKVYGQPDLVNISTVVYLCNLSLNSKNTCVIMMHPQDYADENGRMDQKKYKEFIELIDGLKKLDAKFVNFKDMVLCDSYYWFDETHPNCTQSSFCGIHTYPGLKKFSSQDECLAALNITFPNTSINATTNITVSQSNISANVTITIKKINVTMMTSTTVTPTTIKNTTNQTTTTIQPTKTTVPAKTTTTVTTTTVPTTTSTTKTTTTVLTTTSTSIKATTTTTTMPTTTVIYPSTASSMILETDDYGFYSNGKMVSSASAHAGPVEVFITARNSGIYPKGLDLRGCNQSAQILPGKLVILSFNATSGCTIYSYWPSTDIMKASVNIEII
jgi:hypothetical protein